MTVSLKKVFASVIGICSIWFVFDIWSFITSYNNHSITLHSVHFGENEGHFQMSKDADNSSRTYENDNRVETGLILFTTWVESEEKKTIHLNVMNTWQFWKPIVKPLFFYSDKLTGDQMKEAGWLTLPVSGAACGNSKIPIFRDMFLDAIRNYDSVLYGYANGDITFDNGIATAIEHVMKSDIVREKPVMILVRRFNVDFANRTLLTKSSNFTEIMVGGHALTDGSSDGFFTNKLFPWKYVPDVVVGRIGIGMWMVSYARAMNATIIDITKTVRAIHMTTKSGNKESLLKPSRSCNHDLFHKLKVRPSDWGCGHIGCADFLLSVNKKHQVALTKNIEPKFYCLNCYMIRIQKLFNQTHIYK